MQLMQAVLVGFDQAHGRGSGAPIQLSPTHLRPTVVGPWGVVQRAHQNTLHGLVRPIPMRFGLLGDQLQSLILGTVDAENRTDSPADICVLFAGEQNRRRLDARGNIGGTEMGTHLEHGRAGDRRQPGPQVGHCQRKAVSMRTVWEMEMIHLHRMLFPPMLLVSRFPVFARVGFTIRYDPGGDVFGSK